jgi:hypothetical protein
MINPSASSREGGPNSKVLFYLLRKRDRQGEVAERGDGEMRIGTFLTLAPHSSNSNEIRSGRKSKVQAETRRDDLEAESNTRP